MSRSGETVLEFGGEERTFRLAIGQWRKVQEKCDAGPAEILARLAPAFTARRQGLSLDQILAMGLLGRWRIDDIREVILQGLLGGGMAGPDALRLVRDWVEERPLLESVAVAYAVALAGVIGAEDEKPAGELQAAPAAYPSSRAARSGSAKTASMRSAARSAGTRAPSTL